MKTEIKNHHLLKGKTLSYVHFGGSLMTMVFSDDTFYRVQAEEDQYDGGVFIRSAPVNISDMGDRFNLKDAGIFNEAEINELEKEYNLAYQKGITEWEKKEFERLKSKYGKGE